MTDASAKLLRAVELRKQAQGALLRRLVEEPQDARALLHLGDLHRRMGDFSAASKAYRRLCALRPGDLRASWLCAITAGDRLPAEQPNGHRATPFVHLRNFLSAAEGERLLAFALAQRGRFALGRVGGERGWKVRPLYRRALEASLRSQPEVLAWFAPKLRAALPKVSALLRIDGLEQCDLSWMMAAHLDGGFGKPHRDPGALSCVCYFQPEPRPFSGGDLLLYDTDMETHSYCTTAFSRVEPAANSIVFYAGGYVHEVTPVACGKGEKGGRGEGGRNEELAAARLAVVVTLQPKGGAQPN